MKGRLERTDRDAARSEGAVASQRLDRWLWFARIVKSRTLAADLITDGKVRLNRERVTKPSQTVRAGDIVTATVQRQVRVLRVLLTGERRGPAVEARTLYEDLTSREASGSFAANGSSIAVAPEAQEEGSTAFAGFGKPALSKRPDKRERRQLLTLKGR